MVALTDPKVCELNCCEETDRAGEQADRRRKNVRGHTQSPSDSDERVVQLSSQGRASLADLHIVAGS